MISADGHTDAYWLGSLSMASTLALAALKSRDPDHANRVLRSTLADFLRDPASERLQLRQMLREEMP